MRVAFSVALRDGGARRARPSILSHDGVAQHADGRRLADPKVGPVRDLAEALESEEVAARGMVRTMHHPDVGDFRVLGSVYRLSDTPVGTDTPPPLLGQDSEQVLRDLAECDDVAIADLRTKGVIGGR